MSAGVYLFLFMFCVYTLHGSHCYEYKGWVTTDELENHISPEDLAELKKKISPNITTTPSTGSDEAILDYGFVDLVTRNGDGSSPPETVDCFGLGAVIGQLQWLFNMQPDSVDVVNTHFFFSSRNRSKRVQVYPSDQFGLEWVDFRPERKTIMIVHGFMSHSNASWVTDMTRAFLSWADVNVIAVDWSGGGNTWKYWRAVANTRRVGADTLRFFRRLIKETGADIKDFHFIGHSLGAHIVSYVSHHLGGVRRITGLDPAQPCFRTQDITERLDESDADFVDVIHTNGRLLQKIGFGLPDPAGHADFYPNGGMKQPGCFTRGSFLSKIFPFTPSRLQQAICSHGRAYLLFTESLINYNCSFTGKHWNLTYEGINATMDVTCDRDASCSEMGIRAVGGGAMPRARGSYFVITRDAIPYCPAAWERSSLRLDLLKDLLRGFRISSSARTPPERKHHQRTTSAYADPLKDRDFDDFEDNELTETATNKATTAAPTSWLKRWFG